MADKRNDQGRTPAQQEAHDKFVQSNIEHNERIQEIYRENERDAAKRDKEKD